MSDLATLSRPQTNLTSEKLDIDIEGMSCASCVARVEKALLKVPNVRSATVNLATERATVDIAGGAAQLPVLIAAIGQAGYAGKAVVERGSTGDDAKIEAKADEARVLQRDFVIAAVLSAPLFIVEMGSHLFAPMHHFVMGLVPEQTLNIVYFVLASAVLFGPGLRFLRTGFPALLRGGPDMNSLVAIGTSAAYLYSVVATFAPQILPLEARHVYYEAAVVIVTLILLGRVLEARAKGKTSQAIRHLVGLQAKSARVIRDGVTSDVALDGVVVGEIVVIRPGEKIPVDGTVTDGTSFVDQSMISGEPVPVARGPGDSVIGGTINTSGSLQFVVTRIGRDTMLAQIIAMVEDAQGAKLPIQVLVDKVTGWFVPAVIAAAALTFAVWLIWGPDSALSFAMVNAVAVLIIACPCAMGLATPTSIMVGTGRAAELGVLFRKGEALQALRGAQVVAFDKTGTLTVGHPVLTDLVVTDGFDEAEVLALVAAVESQSEHPIGEAIVAAAKARGLALPGVSGFEASAGYGISALVDGRKIAVGADRYMGQLGLDIGALGQSSARLADEGKTPIYVAIDGVVAAAIAVADEIKPGTAKAIAGLRALGIEVVMISGDNTGTAEAIGRQAGIDRVIGEVLPQGKVDVIRQLQAGGKMVAFVGDGINDAPALAAADIGIAMGNGTDVAIESADVVLVGKEIGGVLHAIELSRATMRNIGQNLFWAFGYNVVLIPVAAGVLYPAFGILLSPMIGAGAMALSSVFVLGNALRLRSVKLEG